MSSHDCSVRGDLDVKEGVSNEQVRAALEPFIEAKGRSDFDKLLSNGSIQFDGVSLVFSIDFYGNGGYQDDNVDALVERLDMIVGSHTYIEVLDFDTGEQESACCPRFIAPDESGRQTARLEYGIMQMADYVSPVIGKEAFDRLSKEILLLPRLASEQKR